MRSVKLISEQILFENQKQLLEIQIKIDDSDAPKTHIFIYIYIEMETNRKLKVVKSYALSHQIQKSSERCMLQSGRKKKTQERCQMWQVAEASEKKIE